MNGSRQRWVVYLLWDSDKRETVFTEKPELWRYRAGCAVLACLLVPQITVTARRVWR
jgi:hypothetical protein